MAAQIRLGISACLLGHRVRYDGGHKFDPFLAGTLGQFVEYLPLCPEQEYGLGVPRETIRLEGKAGSPRLVTTQTRIDITKGMLDWCRKRLRKPEDGEPDGFVFKSRSPSCGTTRVKVFDETGVPAKKGTGIFARAFMDRYPLIPVEDDERLHDPRLRENFFERIFAMKDWRENLSRGKTRANLTAFHGRYRLLLLSHSGKGTRILDRLVAGETNCRPSELYARYLEDFMAAIRLRATNRKNAVVLRRITGFFRSRISADEKRELLEMIDRYRRRLIPLVGPLTLINHLDRVYRPAGLADQVYLNPHPVEMALRNHA
jgi:uncharacterized protein YbgA (DUF1722 family)/uncharacterized protein YbbK (DUF523 family)